MCAGVVECGGDVGVVRFVAESDKCKARLNGLVEALAE